MTEDDNVTVRYAVPGEVIAVYGYFLVRRGLTTWMEMLVSFNRAMRRCDLCEFFSDITFWKICQNIPHVMEINIKKIVLVKQRKLSYLQLSDMVSRG